MSANSDPAGTHTADSERRYVMLTDDSGETHLSIASAGDVFRTLDMADCHGSAIKVWHLTDDHALEPVFLRGPWHDEAEPLRLEIVSRSGEALDTGYGTDH